MKNTEVTEIVILTQEFVKINNLIHIVAPTILKYLKTVMLALFNEKEFSVTNTPKNDHSKIIQN